MKAYTKTKINVNKKIEISETAETPPPLPLNNLRWFARNKRTYHAELIRSESAVLNKGIPADDLFCIFVFICLLLARLSRVYNRNKGSICPPPFNKQTLYTACISVTLGGSYFVFSVGGTQMTAKLVKA